MDYLTQYYKNLSEQLQAKVNHLQRLIETANLTPDNFDGPDANTTGDTAEVVAGQRALDAAMQRHFAIADILSRHHEKVTKGEVSAKNMFKELTTAPYYTKKPFTSVKHAQEVLASTGHEFMPYSISNPSGVPDPTDAARLEQNILKSIYAELGSKKQAKAGAGQQEFQIITK